MNPGKVLQTMGIVGGVKRIGELPPVEKVQRAAKRKMEEAVAKMRAEEREVQRREEAKRAAKDVSDEATAEEKEVGVAVGLKISEGEANPPAQESVVIAAEDLMPSEEGSGIEVREYEIIEDKWSAEETAEEVVGESEAATVFLSSETGETEERAEVHPEEGTEEAKEETKEETKGETKGEVGMSAAAAEYLGKKNRRRRGKKGKKGEGELFA